MLDLKAVRDDPSATLAALERRNDGSQDRLLAALELDSKRRELLPQVESLRAQQNQANDAIAASKRDGGNADEAITKMKAVAAEGKLLKEQLDAVQL
ncbi:MAG: hypothetical protein JHC87_04360, partial [Thermoleophilaceae bacterium]|nr:hypothetical protein [Thermoleophilaceae bacterium]